MKLLKATDKARSCERRALGPLLDSEALADSTGADAPATVSGFDEGKGAGAASLIAEVASS